MIHVVFWPNASRLDGRCDFLELAFPRQSCTWFNNFSDYDTYHPEGAVVVINGSTNPMPGMRELNEELKQFRWVLLISFCDEASGQHLEWIDHPRCSIWVQDPKPGKHDAYHRIPSWPLSGYERYTPAMQNRPLDWFFSGSVRDVAWDMATRALPGNGKHYSDHCGYEEYMHLLASAKFCPCRPCFSGPETCRVYDALEAGCIPIVGIHPAINASSGIPWWPSFNYDWPNYWPYVFGEKPPFPIIVGPQDLLWTFQELLNNWTPEQNIKVRNWWLEYKERFIASLQAEVQRLQE